MLQIAEDAAGVEQAVNFSVKRALALVHEMMNGEAGNDGVELAQRGQRVVEIVGDDGDGGIPGEAPTCSFEHCGRKIDGHSFHAGGGQLSLSKCEQAAVAGAEIKNALCCLRNKLQKGRFSFGAMEDGIGAFEIVAGVAGRSPEVDGSIRCHVCP